MIMAPRILVFVFIFLVGIKAQAQKTLPKDQADVQATVRTMFDALSELDINKMRSCCTTDITILESGKVWNMDTLALRITTRKEKSASFKRLNKLNFLETKISGNTAWVSYNNEAIITYNDKTQTVKWLESVVLIKDKGSWKIALLHSTELERTP